MMSLQVSNNFKLFHHHFLHAPGTRHGSPWHSVDQLRLPCRVERLDLREKLSANQIKELVELFETPLGMIIIH